MSIQAPCPRPSSEPTIATAARVARARWSSELMLLDAVLADNTHGWLGTEHDKVAYFMKSPDRFNFPERDCPRSPPAKGTKKTVRYFPEQLPVGVERGLRPPPCLSLPSDARGPGQDSHTSLFPAPELLKSVQPWTIRLLISAPVTARRSHALRYAVRISSARRWNHRSQGPRMALSPPARDGDTAKKPNDFYLARAVPEGRRRAVSVPVSALAARPASRPWYATSHILATNSSEATVVSNS